jgi:hypothetical protein
MPELTLTSAYLIVVCTIAHRGGGWRKSSIKIKKQIKCDDISISTLTGRYSPSKVGM